MTKMQAEDRPGARGRPACPPLTAGIRRHLGMNLRSFYAATLSEPVSERIEALLVKLRRPKS